jgi:hypothetical protein
MGPTSLGCNRPQRQPNRDITFGMLPKAIIALDTGRRRSAADFQHIQHPNSDTGMWRRKQQMVKRAFGFLAQNEDENVGRQYILRSGNRDTAKAIEANNTLLDQALAIGDDSVKGRSKPPFSASEAAAHAFLLLLSGWSIDQVTADLDMFQSGEDRETGKSPLFVAASLLQKDTAKRERSSMNARLGAAVKAFLLHEQGVKGVNASEIRSAMKSKAWIDPSYPNVTTQRAAE